MARIAAASAGPQGRRCATPPSASRTSASQCSGYTAIGAAVTSGPPGLCPRPGQRALISAVVGGGLDARVVGIQPVQGIDDAASVLDGAVDGRCVHTRGATRTGGYPPPPPNASHRRSNCRDPWPMPDGKGKPGRQARRTASMSLAVCTMLRVGSTAWLGVNTSKPSINSAGHNSSAQPILRLATLDQQHGDPSPLDDRQHQPAEVRGPVQLVVHGGDQRPARGHPRSPRRCSGGHAGKSQRG